MISIYCFKDVNDEIIYVGSTNDMKKRYNNHKGVCNNENNYPVYQYMRDNNGIENFKFKKICDIDEEYRRITEQFYIDTFKPKCNTYNAIVDNKEYKKEYNKVYYEKNKEYKKEYDKKNKDKKNKRQKEYREKNKEKMKENRVCCRACRCELRRSDLQRHFRTQKHIKNL